MFAMFVSGMNGAVRAVVRMGFYLGCKVYFIKEVGDHFGFNSMESQSVQSNGSRQPVKVK